MRPAALGRVRAALLLPDRPLRGLVEPRPLRRRPLRAPRRATATSARCTSARATPGSATSRSAGSCSAPTRSRPATTTRTTARRRRCGRSSATSTAPRSSSSTSSSARPRRRSRSSSARAPTTRSRCTLRDVLTIPSNMAGLPGLSIPCGLSEGLPGRLQLIGRAVLREPALPRRPRARAGARVRLRPGAAEVSWEPVIGLEIHVHLKTRTKMFCRCEVAYFEPAEHAHVPGLPRAPGRAAGAEPRGDRDGRSCSATRSAARSPSTRVFHRKNYFYPDTAEGLPDLPVRPAALRRRQRSTCPAADGDRVVGIVRAHLEEDAAKTMHVGGAEGRIRGAERSLVDFNRAGTPLVEIVTEPDIRSAERGEARSCSCCGRRSSSSGSRTRRWRRARCASTSTSRCGPRAPTSCARAPS